VGAQFKKSVQHVSRGCRKYGVGNILLKQVIMLRIKHLEVTLTISYCLVLVLALEGLFGMVIKRGEPHSRSPSQYLKVN